MSFICIIKIGDEVQLDGLSPCRTSANCTAEIAAVTVLRNSTPLGRLPQADFWSTTLPHLEHSGPAGCYDLPTDKFGRRPAAKRWINCHLPGFFV